MQLKDKSGRMREKSIFSTLKPLVLASASPRRKRYFEDLGLDFTVLTSEVEETNLPGENPEEFVKRMAEEKAMAVIKNFPKSWVVAADTVVVFDDRILGKPDDEDHAEAMLMALSGHRHYVQTGFCIGCEKEEVLTVNVETTSVEFIDFTKDVARAYVATGEPLDKAGSYGIQGLGAFLVATLTGSYSNVVGLPLHEVIACLCRHGVIAAGP
jgi:septum formation protein